MGDTYGGYSVDEEDWGELRRLQTHWYTLADRAGLEERAMTLSEWKVWHHQNGMCWRQHKLVWLGKFDSKPRHAPDHSELLRRVHIQGDKWISKTIKTSGFYVKGEMLWADGVAIKSHIC